MLESDGVGDKQKRIPVNKVFFFIIIFIIEILILS